MTLIDDYVANISGLNTKAQILNHVMNSNGANSSKPLLDSAKDAFDKESNVFENGTFFSRNFTFSGNMIQSFGIAFCTGVLFRDYFKLLKENPSKLMKNPFYKNAVFKLGIVTLAGYGLSFIINKISTKNIDKKLQKFKDLFNKENKTSAKFREKPLHSNIIEALYNAASGEIIISKDALTDPYISNVHTKFTLRHELEHARQYEMIARSENGIAKLNYSIIKRCANSLDKKLVYEFYKQMMSEISLGVPDKYKNMTISLEGYEVNMIDFVSSVWKVHNDKNVKLDELPILINKNHYQAVRDKNPPLTPEEEYKANEYFKAACNYLDVNVFTTLNPCSDYYSNLLEKEAFKKNPWYTRII